MMLSRRPFGRMAVLVLPLLLIGSAERYQPPKISGRVVDERGFPVERAVVEAHRLVGPAAQIRSIFEGVSTSPIVSTFTGAAGRFELSVPEPGFWRVGIRARGFVSLELGLDPLLESMELSPAKLAKDAGVIVRVLSDDERPASRSIVRLERSKPRSASIEGSIDWEPAAQLVLTDIEGRVSLSCIAGDRLSLAASAPGHYSYETPVTCGRSLTVRLAKGQPQILRVLTPEGRPARSVVALNGQTGQAIGLAGADGQISLSRHRGAGLLLDLIDPDLNRLKLDLSPPSEDKVLTASLRAPVVFTGRVIDKTNQRPIEGALVYRTDEPWTWVSTDRVGRYRLSADRGEVTVIGAEAVGYLRSVTEHAILGSADRTGPVLALSPASTIEGVVLAPDGRSVEWAQVSAEPLSSAGGVFVPKEAESSRVNSDANGRFRIARINPVYDYLVSARALGYSPARDLVAGLEPGRTHSGLRLVLSQGLTAAGILADPQGNPVDQGTVRLVRDSLSRPRTSDVDLSEQSTMDTGFEGHTDRLGNFKIVDVPQGVYNLMACRTGFSRLISLGHRVLPDSQPSFLGAFTLEPGQLIHGRVRSVGGEPIDGVEVKILERSSIKGCGNDSWDRPDAVTSAEGSFTISELPQKGSVDLLFVRKGHVTATRTGVSIPTSGPLEVVMYEASKIAGAVYDERRRPASGVLVRLVQSSTRSKGGQIFGTSRSEEETSDTEGRFRFLGVQPGDVSVSAETVGFAGARIDKITVVAGKDIDDLKLTLSPAAVVSGRVASTGGRPIPEATVRQVPGPGDPFGLRTRRASTDGSGAFRLMGLPVQRLSIEARHPDYLIATREIDLVAGENTIDFELDPGKSVLGRVTDAWTGAPIGGAIVQLIDPGTKWEAPTTKARRDGTFEVRGMARGDFLPAATARGYAPYRAETPLRITEAGVRDLEIALEPGSSLVGRVVGLEPMEFPSVKVRADGPGGFAECGIDRLGRYRLTDLGKGQYTVTASIGDTGKQARGVAEIAPGVAESTLDIYFQGGLKLSGTVVMGDRPLDAATILSSDHDAGRFAWTETDREGRFVLQGLDPGTYEIAVRRWVDGVNYSITTRVGKDLEVTVRVPTGRISGRVLSASDGLPISEARVQLFRPHGETVVAQGPTLAATGTDGRFELRNLPEGRWALTLSKEGYIEQNSSIVIEEGGDSFEIIIQLVPTTGIQ